MADNDDDDDHDNIYEEREKTYADVVALAFAKVFVPDSWNPLYENVFNGENLETADANLQKQRENEIYLYYQNDIIRLTAILGVANKCPRGEEPERQHILNNTIFGTDVITLRAVYNTLKLLLVIVPVIPLYNCLRILTEFLPCLLADSIEYLAEACNEERQTAEATAPHNRTSHAAMAWNVLSNFMSYFLLPVSSLFKIIARATTKPDGFIDAYHSGKKLGGPFLGCALAGLSLVATGLTFAGLSLAVAPIASYMGIDIGFHIADGMSNTPALITFFTETAAYLNVSFASTGLFFYGFLAGLFSPIVYSLFKWLGCDVPDLDNKLHIASIKSAEERRAEEFLEQDSHALHSNLFTKKNILDNPEESIEPKDSNKETSEKQSDTHSSTSSSHAMERRKKSTSSLSTSATLYQEKKENKKSSSTTSSEEEEEEDEIPNNKRFGYSSDSY